MLRPYHGRFLSVPFSVDLNLEGLNFLASVKQIEDLQLLSDFWKHVSVFFCSIVFKARSPTVPYSFDYLVGRQHGIAEAFGNTLVTV